MLASWYDEQGPAADVLHVGELPDPEPGPGEVRVRVTVSGVNPGDTKKRRGWLGSSMPYPHVIPHSDAAGVLDRVGDGVDARRVGQRVWVYGAQSYRASGTAAQYTVVPDRLAGQLARGGGATVIGTVRRAGDLDHVDPAAVSHAVALDTAGPAADIRAHAPGGVHRVAEVSLSANADLDNAVTAPDAVIAAYGTHADRTELPFWPMLFNNITLRLLGSDDFPADARRQAARDLTAAAAVGALTVDIGDRYPLTDIAKAHERVDAGGRGRVLITVAN